MKNRFVKIMAVLFAILFGLSLTQTYFLVGNTVVHFTDILTSLISIVIGILYLISFFSKNEEMNRITSLLLSLCYFLTFHSIYTIYCYDNYLIVFLWTKELIFTFIVFAIYFLSLVVSKNKDGFDLFKVLDIVLKILVIFTAINIYIDNIVILKPGICLYFASFFPILINAFFMKDKIVTREPAEKMIKEPIDMTDSYIFANYVAGLKDDYNIKNNLAVLLNKEDTHELVIGIYKNDAGPIRIEHYRVQKIVLRREPLQMNTPKKKDLDIEKLTVLGILLKNFGGEMASDELTSRIDEYCNIKTKIVNHIIITYEVKKENKYIHIYTKEDDSIFFETLEKTLPFPVERIV